MIICKYNYNSINIYIIHFLIG